LATDQLNKREFNKLGFGPKVLAKIKNLSIRDQGSVYSNLIDDIAIERTIRKGLIIRRLLLFKKTIIKLPGESIHCCCEIHYYSVLLAIKKDYYLVF
jgi:hypothetical protein